MSKSSSSGAKRPSGPKALILFLFLSGSSALVSAQGLWPSLEASSLLFPLLPEIQLPVPSASDSIPSPYVPTIGELKVSLAYFNAYEELFKLFNETVVPNGRILVDRYNNLVVRTQVLTVATVVLSGFCIGLLIAGTR